MTLEDLLIKRNLTIYKVSKDSGVAKSTLFDIISGKSNILDCKVRVLKKLSDYLNISIDELVNLDQIPYNPFFENNNPEFLEYSLKMYKKNRNRDCSLIDCYYCELQSSINSAEVENLISSDHANYLRKKYLGIDLNN